MSNQLVQEFLSQRRLEEAKEQIDLLVSREPEKADNFYYLGIYHYFKNNLPSAIQNLKRCLELDSKHTDAAICLSVLLNDVGNYQEGKKIFDKANQSLSQPSDSLTPIDQKFSFKHLELGDLYLRYQRYDEAIHEFSKAILLNPSSNDSKLKRARAFAKKGLVTRALQELETIKREQPKFLAARTQLGLLHYCQGNPLDAEEEWKTVLKIDPTHQEAYSKISISGCSSVGF